MRVIRRARRALTRPGRKHRAREFDRAVAEFFMRLALAEAQKGVGRTAPNPPVGAVLVRSGRVVGRGHHQRAGAPHAEVVALRRARDRSRGADLYTTLEPCNHQGRTPPCTAAILARGVRRVYLGNRDPNPKVSGGGVRRLRRAGVPVFVGILAKECEKLNAPFFCLVSKGRPFVTMKIAMSSDGRIATASGDSKWITGDRARALVHELRDKVDAVLVGAGTVRADDPRLTSRIPNRKTRDPIRVVLDSRLSLPSTARVFRRTSRAATWVAAARDASLVREKRLTKNGVEVIRCRSRGGRIDVRDLLAKLGQRGVMHLLVEGGAETYGSFLSAGVVDRLMLFIAPVVLGQGGKAWASIPGARRVEEAMRLKPESSRKIGADILIEATVAGS
jgi:diaminohydroxyphosphoribosylaminopyrimidine deaminase / 5-amino-6-(5-phosphoribosylamino)uracil reductase